jgi:hypothetical protein
VQVLELADGLWRWTAEHPEWRPGEGWEPTVAGYYVEADDATLLIDPQLPSGADEARFWSHLDEDVTRRGRPVVILLTTPYHRRSADVVADGEPRKKDDHTPHRQSLRGGAHCLDRCEVA